MQQLLLDTILALVVGMGLIALFFFALTRGTLLLRALAVALLVIAFARPFLERSAFGVADAVQAREIVVLLDRSASMGYGDRWDRARVPRGSRNRPRSAASPPRCASSA